MGLSVKNVAVPFRFQTIIKGLMLLSSSYRFQAKRSRNSNNNNKKNTNKQRGAESSYSPMWSCTNSGTYCNTVAVLFYSWAKKSFMQRSMKQRINGQPAQGSWFYTCYTKSQLSYILWAIDRTMLKRCSAMLKSGHCWQSLKSQPSSTDHRES